MTVVDDIKSRLDILDVVSQHVTLNRSGRSYKANCPFHQERTPSFHVFPDQQTWRCFGACAMGGDLFSFVMRAENLDFTETLKRLAQQAGVAVPGRERRTEQESAFQINEVVKTYFQELLSSSRGAGARAYLERRGVSKEAIADFELGLSPGDGESLKNHLMKLGHSPQQLAQAGVVHVTDSGWARDLFRSRLMIPIRDNQGALGGFGGRALDDSDPKYLNSPRTPVFDKGRILYALYVAKQNAGHDGLVVVEGYMDVIAAHQHGFTNVVASMGTALTEHQVAAIARITSNVTIALDPDAAGRQATLRSLEGSWRVFQSRVAGQAQGTTLYQRRSMPELKIAALPEGRDPDQVIRQSPEEWAHLIEGATPYLDYLIPALSTQVDASTPQGKARLVELIFPLIAAVAEPAQQDQYFQSLANHLGVTQETLKATIGRPAPVRRTARRTTQSRGATASPFAKLDSDPLEDYCLAFLLQHPELIEPAEDLRPEYFGRLENREIFNQWTREYQSGPGEPVLPLIQAGIDGELTGHLDSLINKELPPLEERLRTGAFQDAVHRLEERYLKELKTEEEMRFTEVLPDLREESHESILQVNQRLRTNQSKRSSMAPDISKRG